MGQVFSYHEPDQESDEESGSDEQPQQNVAPGEPEANDGAFGPLTLALYFGAGAEGGESFGFDLSAPVPDANPAEAILDLNSPIFKTPTIKSAVNLIKSSLKLVPAEEDLKFGVQFAFDSATACNIQVSFTKEGMSAWEDSFQAGSGQIYFSQQNFISSELFSSEPGIDGGVFSIVIHLESTEEGFEIRSQSTHCSIIKMGESNFEIRATKQKVMYSAVPYVVYDIFGLENGVALTEDCVICRSEAKDTVFIPCRHLCICSQCAQVLKYQSNKCPICRSSVRSMLSVNIKSEVSEPVLDVQIDSDTENLPAVVEPLTVN